MTHIDYNLSPREAYRYTGAVSEPDMDMLLEQHEALERIRDVFYDIDSAVEERKPKTVLELIQKVNAIFDEVGL